MKRAAGISERIKAVSKLLKDGRKRSALELAAIRRQQLDLEQGHRRGLVWDEEAAQRAVAFFPLLRHWKGEWAQKPFELSPWQEHAIIAPLFGWKRDGLRRFRTGYIEVPRKNGKTTLLAGVGLQGLVADAEEGPEVYCAATMRDQATICFADAVRCPGPQLKKLLKAYQFALRFEQANGTFRPLSSDHDTLDGLNPSRVIVDELHAHKDRGLWDVLLGGMGARRQPLLLAITTAGVDRTSICWEVRELVRQVLESDECSLNDSLFGFIACADEDDDWQDPETWRKANPGYGVTVKAQFLEELAKQAAASGSAEGNFRRKHLNQWVGAESRWISAPSWDGCRSPLKSEAFRESLRGRECFAGIDLGWRDDFAALGLVFPERIAKVQPPAETVIKETSDGPLATARCQIRRCALLGKLYVPSHGRRDIHEKPLADWIARGLVEVTEGNSTDPNAILRDLNQAQEFYQLREAAIDPNNARQFGQELQALGVPVFEFWQSKRNYNEPCREFERLAAAGLLEHDGDELARWMILNVVMEADARGYVMPAKHKSAEKIDLPVAWLMGFARAMFTEIAGECVYERRGMLIL